MNRKRLHNRVALIAGISGDLESTLSYKLAEQGCHVIVGIKHREKLGTLEKKLQRFRSGVVCQQTDISHHESMRTLVQVAFKHFARIDFLVIHDISSGQTLPLGPGDMNGVRIEAKTNHFLVSEVLPHMSSRRTGHIIIISTFETRKVVPFGTRNDSLKRMINRPQGQLMNEMRQNAIHYSAIYPYVHRLYQQEKYNHKYGEKVSRAVLQALSSRKSEISVPRFLPNVFSFLNLSLLGVQNRFSAPVYQKQD